MAQPIHVLIIENSEDDAILVAEQLRRSGYDPNWKMVDNAADLTEALATDSWDLFLCDYSMPGFSGMKALEIYKTFGLDIPFFLVSGLIGEERAVEAMRAGAHDCIMKDRLSRLGPAVERELREAANRRERRQADLELHHLKPPGGQTPGPWRPRRSRSSRTSSSRLEPSSRSIRSHR